MSDDTRNRLANALASYPMSQRLMNETMLPSSGNNPEFGVRSLLPQTSESGGSLLAEMLLPDRGKGLFERVPAPGEMLGLALQSVRGPNIPHLSGRLKIEDAVNRMIQSGRGSEWIQVPEGQLFARYNRQGGNIDLANMDFHRKGTGAFTSYLNHIEDMMLKNPRQVDQIVVENIFNPRLADFLARRGYSTRGHWGFEQNVPTMVMPRNRLELLDRSAR